MPEPISEDRVAAAVAELDRVRRRWLRRPGVTAVDVGYRIRGDVLTDELAVRAHVERKLPPADVAAEDLFTTPDDQAMLGEFPVDVLEAAYVPCHDPACAPAEPGDVDPRDRSTPLMGGLSVGSPLVSAGTLGAVVWDRADGSAHLLSNWHVLDVRAAGDPGAARCGQCGQTGPQPYYHSVPQPYYHAAVPQPYYHAGVPQPYYHAGVPQPYYHAGVPQPYYHAGVPQPYYHAVPVAGAVYQPGPVDGGTPADTVAYLSRSRLDRHMDAALARLDGSRPYLRDQLGLEAVRGVAAPRLGMRLVKSGRSTGVTQGLLDGVSLSTTITYAHGPQAFEDQIHIVPRPPWPRSGHDYEVSDAGDSGAVWVEEDSGMAVGLNFAGERDPQPSSEHALANPMVRVAEELGFSFTPLVCRGPSASYGGPPAPGHGGAVPAPPSWPGTAAELERLRAAIDVVLAAMRG